jgi:hypothetical protein
VKKAALVFCPWWLLFHKKPELGMEINWKEMLGKGFRAEIKKPGRY